jgi:ABC-2 type transport system permease protein
MTATTVPSVTPYKERSAPAYRKASIFDVVRSEWTKFRTVRSTWWCIFVTIVLVLAIGGLVSWASGYHYSRGDASDRLTFDPTARSTAGAVLGQLSMAVLGILFITSEYSSGMIRSSLAAVPRRGRILGVKAALFAAVSLVVGEVLAFGSFVMGQAILKSQGAPTASLSNGTDLRAVVGVGLYLVVLAIIALGIGAIVRSTAVAIVTVVVMLYVVPAILAGVNDSVTQGILKYWPTQAGAQIVQVHRDAHTLSAWPGFAVMVIFGVVVLAAALFTMNRRDA